MPRAVNALAASAEISSSSTGNTRGAALDILEPNIFGGACARVCPTEVLCEEACVRTAQEDKPVRIGLLQRYATDTYMSRNLPHPFKRAAATGKKVAVVGAGHGTGQNRPRRLWRQVGSLKERGRKGGGGGLGHAPI